MMVNKRDKVHHETEVCDFRRVKCHDCAELKKEVTEMKDQVAAQTHQMEEKMMKGITSLMDEIKNLKEEVNGIKKTVQEHHPQSRGDIIIAGGDDEHVDNLNSVEMFSWLTKS